LRSEKEGGWNNALNVNSSLRPHEGILPKRFMISIGGFGGHRHEVRLINKRLLYRAGFNNPPVKIYPTADQWENFWTTADGCGLWNWESCYYNNDVCDGIQWKLEIEIGTRSITSFGSNRYPGSTGMSYSKSFSLFLKAMRRLIGGRKFG
jgi:hypothetical protein